MEPELIEQATWAAAFKLLWHGEAKVRGINPPIEQHFFCKFFLPRLVLGCVVTLQLHGCAHVDVWPIFAIQVIL